MNRKNNNAQLSLLGAIAALAFCAAVVVFFYATPYYQLPVATITAPPADCLPNGSGGPCIPFDQIQKMMDEKPDPVPTNPAAANEEKI
jgi:hypothetical protein